MSMIEKEKTDKTKIVYRVDGGAIYREDRQAGAGEEMVAKYDQKTGVVELCEGYEHFRTAIIRHINDKGYHFETVGRIGMSIDRSKAPPKPKMSFLEGDKTPGVVEWYAQHFPQEFISRYGVRQLRVRSGFRELRIDVRNKETGQKETHIRQVPVYEPVDHLEYDLGKLKTGEHELIANAKTHLTVTVAADSGSVGDYDESLDARIAGREAGVL